MFLESLLDAVGFAIWATLLFAFPVWLGAYFVYEVVKFYWKGGSTRRLGAERVSGEIQPRRVSSEDEKRAA